MPRQAWKQTIGSLFAAFSSLSIEVLFKFHPSEDADAEEYVRSCAPDNVTFVDAPLSELLHDVDLLFTFFSTSFLDALQAGIPTLFYDAQGLTVFFPQVAHLLIRRAGNVDELLGELRAVQNGTPSPRSAQGRPLEDFIADRSTASEIVRITTAMIQERTDSQRPSAEKLAAHAAGYFESRHLTHTRTLFNVRTKADEFAERADYQAAVLKRQPHLEPDPLGLDDPGKVRKGRMSGLKRRYLLAKKELRGVPVRKTLRTNVGSAKDLARAPLDAIKSAPAMSLSVLKPAPELYVVLWNYKKAFGGDVMVALEYVKRVRERYKRRAEIIDLCHHDIRALQTRLRAHPAPVLINGVRVLESPRIDAVLESGCDVFVYLHETEWVFAKFARSRPARLVALARAYRNLTFLCVSEDQARMVRQAFDGARAEVVYNTVDVQAADDAAKRSSSLRRSSQAPYQVVMTGSVQPRKGATLFSAVADLALTRGLPLEFSWIGPFSRHFEPVVESPVYRSEVVHWRGPRSHSETLQALANADVFFLPSIDDPFPRSFLEAAIMGKKLVASQDLALAQLLRGTPGTSFFTEFSAEAALDALEKVLASEPDRDRMKRTLGPIVDADLFAKTLSNKMGIPLGE